MRTTDIFITQLFLEADASKKVRKLVCESYSICHTPPHTKGVL